MQFFIDLKGIFLALSVVATLLLGSLMMPLAFAQFQQGGVDKEGSWYSGEGLKHGDYFSYQLCHFDYKECLEFEMDLWIKGDKQVGNETKWLAEAVVYDGRKVIVGELELGKIDAKPTRGSKELDVYRDAFGSSVAWLSAFAVSTDLSGGKGPKEFTATSWGKIGNIGGEQVSPQKIETITVPAGTWETVQIGWKTGGASSKVWVVDDFPFPVKAETFIHVSEGIPPIAYKFTLLEYEENIKTSPFVGIESTVDPFEAQGCDTNIEKEVTIKKSTTNFKYQLNLFYGPEDPVQHCEMHWLINFINIYDDTEFLNQVQFDFLVVDDDLKQIRSIAHEEGVSNLYSPSGQYPLDMVVKEDPGTANYVVWVHGLAREGIAPSTPADYLVIPVTIFEGKGGSASDQSTSGSVTPPPSPAIPDWIKTNAGWWADGSIDDDSFVQGIQFLIKEGILEIPPTTQGSGAGSDAIPDWIKTNAGWWADGSIDDDSFVQGIQFLIKEGIMNIS